LFPAAVIMTVEGLAALGLSIVEFASTNLARPAVGLGTGVVFLAWAFGLVFVAWYLRRARRWSRSAAVCSQLVHLPIAYSFAVGSAAWGTAIAAAMAIPSVAVLVMVFVPSSTAAFNAAPLPGPQDEG